MTPILVAYFAAALATAGAILHAAGNRPRT